MKSKNLSATDIPYNQLDADAVKAVWESEEIQATFKRQNELHLEEYSRYQYFFRQVHKMMDESSYVLTNQDILQLHERSTITCACCQGQNFNGVNGFVERNIMIKVPDLPSKLLTLVRKFLSKKV